MTRTMGLDSTAMTSRLSVDRRDLGEVLPTIAARPPEPRGSRPRAAHPEVRDLVRQVRGDRRDRGGRAHEHVLHAERRRSQAGEEREDVTLLGSRSRKLRQYVGLLTLP